MFNLSTYKPWYGNCQHATHMRRTTANRNVHKLQNVRENHILATCASAFAVFETSDDWKHKSQQNKLIIYRPCKPTKLCG